MPLTPSTPSMRYSKLGFRSSSFRLKRFTCWGLSDCCGGSGGTPMGIYHYLQATAGGTRSITYKLLRSCVHCSFMREESSTNGTASD